MAITIIKQHLIKLCVSFIVLVASKNIFSSSYLFNPQSNNLKERLGLDLHRTPTKEEIKKSFRKASLIYHPDKGGNTEDFIKIKEAYDLLTRNPNRELLGSFYESFRSSKRRQRSKYSSSEYKSHHSSQNRQEDNWKSLFEELKMKSKSRTLQKYLSIKEINKILNGISSFTNEKEKINHYLDLIELYNEINLNTLENKEHVNIPTKILESAFKNISRENFIRIPFYFTATTLRVQPTLTLDKLFHIQTLDFLKTHRSDLFENYLREFSRLSLSEYAWYLRLHKDSKVYESLNQNKIFDLLKRTPFSENMPVEADKYLFNKRKYTHVSLELFAEVFLPKITDHEFLLKIKDRFLSKSATYNESTLYFKSVLNSITAEDKIHYILQEFIQKNHNQSKLQFSQMKDIFKLLKISQHSQSLTLRFLMYAVDNDYRISDFLDGSELFHEDLLRLDQKDKEAKYHLLRHRIPHGVRSCYKFFHLI